MTGLLKMGKLDISVAEQVTWRGDTKILKLYVESKLLILLA